jgi:predicted O-methyltransferase YrrM
MSQELWNDVDRYIVEQLLEDDPALDRALMTSREYGLPAINVAPNQGKLLHLLVRSLRARRILELGTLGGYSTIWLARALPPDGQLITLELSEKHAEIARQNIEHAGFGDQVEIRVGPALEGLAQLSAQHAEPFDLIFIDADKPNTAEYFEGSLSLARVGTVIFVDNLVRQGGLIDEQSTDENIVGMRRLMDALHGDDRVSVTAVQTVGSKGHDGFAYAVVDRV